MSWRLAFRLGFAFATTLGSSFAPGAAPGEEAAGLATGAGSGGATQMSPKSNTSPLTSLSSFCSASSSWIQTEKKSPWPLQGEEITKTKINPGKKYFAEQLGKQQTQANGKSMPTREMGNFNQPGSWGTGALQQAWCGLVQTNWTPTGPTRPTGQQAA